MRQFRSNWETMRLLKWGLKQMFTCGMGFHNIEDYKDPVHTPPLHTKICKDCFERFAK